MLASFYTRDLVADTRSGCYNSPTSYATMSGMQSHSDTSSIGAAHSDAGDSTSPGPCSQVAAEEPQLRKSCDYCVRMKRGCDGGTPCELCLRRNKLCIRSVKKRSGPAKGTKYCKRRARKKACAPRAGVTQADSSINKPTSATSGRPSGRAARSSNGVQANLKSNRSPQKVTANTSSVRGCRTEPLSLSAAAAAVTQPSVKCANSTTTAVALSATVPEATIAASALVRCERQQRNSIDKGELATAVCDDEGPTVAFAAAAAVEASQARWPTNRCMDTADIIPQGDPGFSLPFHYPPEATVNNSPSCQLYQGVRGGVVGVGGADDRANRNGGAGAAFAGYSSEVFQTNGSNPAATRMAEAKRNSIEQALYGSCMKRTSFNALLGSLDFDVESEDVVGDVVGLLRNHRYHADGSPSYVQDDGFAFAEPDTGSSNNKNTSSNNGSNSADRSVQKHVRPATGSLASFPGSAAPCFRATNTNISFLDPSQSFFLGGGAGSNCGGRGPVEPVGSSFAGTISGGLYETTGGMPSLRDLLLERGPPAPPVSNEFMLAESI